MNYRHKWQKGVMVEEGMREREAFGVKGQQPHNAQKMPWLAIFCHFLGLQSRFFKQPRMGKQPKIKVVDFKKLYNFVVDNFFIWNHLFKENYIWISKF